MPEERPFIFKDGPTELILPVTPGSYKVDNGINIEVVNIHELGDVIIAGYGTLSTIKIDCLLPANEYPFASGDSPSVYLEQFQKWIDEKKVIRFIIGGTGVNIAVMVQSVSHGEEDGTNDIYADILLREYRPLEAVQVSFSASDSAPRELPEEHAPSEQQYAIVYGDTLSALCRKFYGDGSPATYNRLAAYNGISNPNLIYAGNTLKIPKPLP